MNVSSGSPALTSRTAKLLFVLALLVTLVSLLATGAQVLVFKVWVASWLPFAAQVDAADMSQNSDKLVHATMFACMGYLAVRGWTQRRHLAWVLLGVLWLAPQTEWLQAYIPGRGADWADVLADVLGLALGVVCSWVLHRAKRGAAAQQPNGELPGQPAPVVNGARLGQTLGISTLTTASCGSTSKCFGSRLKKVLVRDGISAAGEATMAKFTGRESASSGRGQ
ncbi:MAG TPA: VanZ family protein [Burkholderiaceae bacterium]|nr:VanZ family protein [Burkholderiaceae bacterium]